METSKQPGRIITFYSYKGGTGRSMALANVAWVLASNGKKVLVVDWDLEAPGLHRYFHPFLVDRDLSSSDGVVDFVIDYATEAMTPTRPGETVPPDWYRKHANITRYAASLEWEDWELPRGGTLDFVGAGRQGLSYSTRVNTFDWRGFYDRHGGGVFLEAVRDKMREEYDYILLDSRTGVSDTSGICTVQMPDDLVVCFTLNNQSIEGAASVAASVQSQRGASGIRIFPVPTRVELAEKDKLEVRRAYARERLGLFPSHLGPAERDRYWGAVEMLYVPYYAYEEVLSPFGDRLGTFTSLLGSVERLTSYLTAGEVEQTAAVPEPMRLQVLSAYARRGTEEMPEDERARTAEAAYLRLSAEQQTAARRALSRMVRVSRPDEGGMVVAARLPLGEHPEARGLIAPFMAAGLVTCDIDPVLRDEVVQWTDPGLIEHWPRLRRWIQDNRDFLLWRQKLRADLADWDSNLRDPGALQIGAPLATACRWLQLRRDDLTAAEVAYIEASAEAARGSRFRILAAKAGVALFLILSVVGGLFLSWSFRQREAEQQAAESYFDRGSSLLQDGLLEAALQSFDQATKIAPASDRALLGQANVYYRQSELDRALQSVDQAIEIADSGPARLLRGQILVQKQDLRGALEEYNRALRLSPQNTDALLARGKLLLNQRQLDKAIADFDRALELQPDFAEAHFQRGRAYHAKGARKAAIASFNETLRHSVDPLLAEAAQVQLSRLNATESIRHAAPAAQVSLLYQDENDAAVVAQLERTLREQDFLVATEVRPGLSTVGEVRYFSVLDATAAEQVTGLIENVIADQGYPLYFPTQYRREGREGRIEVRLPSLAKSQLLVPTAEILNPPPAPEIKPGPQGGRP